MLYSTKTSASIFLAFLPAICAAACNTSDAGSETGTCTQDDEIALLQHGLHIRHHQQRVPLARDHEHEHHVQPPSGSLVQRLQEQGKFDCHAYPALCQAPFNCHEVNPVDTQQWMMKGAAHKGRPNYKLWCAVPHYEAYASRCAVGDLDGAGKIQFHLTTAGHFGPLTKEMDGSYCFIDGHCANGEVTNDTTVQDAIEMCDARFGRQAWAAWGSESMPQEDHLDYSVPTDMTKGYQNPEQTRPSLLAACAMGNYHCDVRYCLETYCKEEYYVKKYGHLLKKFGWVQ